ncbi:VOC family protein [Dyella sp. ASV21]|uniref:VOC family protein n=1 Tax=Dyella sp. ASV21 TaxID=2795114 RepID=UPI0018EB4706|nr:VOC family protein [Dyella sp. ASV21]
MPPSQEHHVGKVIFVELVTPDLAATERFYSGLLGWVFQNDRSGDRQYAAALVNGHLVAELMQKPLTPGTRKQPAWLGFLAVRDVDATERSALQDGAKLLYGPRDFPGRGREAVFSDPQGAVFAVLASSSGDPPDTLAAPGEWIWSALITNDPDADAAFYQKLFHYEIYDVTGDAAEQHLLLASDSYARASANTLPGNRSVAYSHWLNFIRVNDAAAMSARVVALGGRVLVEPRIDRHGGMVAVVADPNGTPFGLLEWPDAETKLVMP